ncbi:GP179 protein, partial [Rostratula benghalensis]|nr:GP179 protein [Rostratula benghalensis]
DEGLEGGTGSIRSQDHPEVEQPSAEPTAGSPHPPTSGVGGTTAKKLGAEVCPRAPPGVPAGKAALLRQQAIAPWEDSGVPWGRESPAKGLEKGGNQPESLGPTGSWGAQGVPAKSQSVEVVPAAVGKASSVAAEVSPGPKQGDSRIKIEICPWEESGSEHWGGGRALGKGDSEGDRGHPRGELGMEKPPAKSPELPKAASEMEGSRAAEVCPWESRGGGRTIRAEICPWDVEGAPAEGERQQGAPSPREGAEQPSVGLMAKHPALPKPAGTMGSKKANICPWEEEEETRPKAEICPWEEPGAPSGKEGPSQDTLGTSKGENKPGSAEMGGRRPEHKDSRIFAKLIR